MKIIKIISRLFYGKFSERKCEKRYLNKNPKFHILLLSLTIPALARIQLG